MTNKYVFQTAESVRDAVVPASVHNGHMSIVDGRLQLDYDLSDFRAVRGKTGTLTLVYKRRVKQSELSTYGFTVKNGDESLTIKDESISFTIEDDHARVIRAPKAVKAEVAKCRTEFNKLVREQTWSLAKVRDFYNGVDPTLTIRGKRIDHLAFDFPVNIAAAGKPERVTTFKDWVASRIQELDSKTATPSMQMAQTLSAVRELPGFWESVNGLTVQEQASAIADALLNRGDEIQAIVEQKIAERAAAKLAASRAKQA